MGSEGCDRVDGVVKIRVASGQMSGEQASGQMSGEQASGRVVSAILNYFQWSTPSKRIKPCISLIRDIYKTIRRKNPYVWQYILQVLRTLKRSVDFGVRNFDRFKSHMLFGNDLSTAQLIRPYTSSLVDILCK